MKHFNLLKQLLLIPLLVLAAGATALAQPLNGVYTIGGTSPSYATLAAAVADLNTKGVSGKVWFNIRTGTYSSTTNWVADINGTYVGASDPNNRVTFQSESGNKADVTISNANSSTVNFIFKFNGAQNITVRNMTLASTDATNSRLIEIAGSANKDSVYNCNLNAPATTTTSNTSALVYGNGFTGNNNVIYNNVITNGAYGVHLFGSSTTYPVGTVVSANTITNQYYFGTYFYYLKDLNVTNNTITKASNTTTYNAAYFYLCNDALRVNNNTISLTGTSSTHYGIYIVSSTGSSTNSALRGTVNNNTVTMSTSSGSQYHLYLGSTSSYYTVSGNTVSGTATSTSSSIYPIYNTSSSTYNTITANTFTVTNAGAIWTYPANSYCHNTTFTNNTFNYTTTSSGINYGMYNAAYYSDNCVFTGNTLNFTGNGSGTIYGWYYAASNYSNNNNISNNTLTVGGTGTGQVYGFSYCMYWYANNNLMNNNTTSITRTGSGAIYPYNYCIYYYANNNTISNNTTTVSSTGSAALYGFNYCGYMYNANVKFTGNKLTQTGNSTIYSSQYMGGYYNDGVEISNNEISSTGTTTTYGMMYPGYYYNYNFYVSNTTAKPFKFNNNKITTISTTNSTVYGVYYLGYYSYGDVEFNNNQVVSTGGSTLYGAYIYQWYGMKTNANGNTITTTQNSTGTTYGFYIYAYYYSSGYDNSVWANNNTVTTTRTGTNSGTTYGMYLYRYYYPNITLGRTVTNNNVIRTTNGGSNTVYGLYWQPYMGVNDTLNNNDVQATSGSGTVYGIMEYYHAGGETKNNAVSTNTTGTTYAMYCNYPLNNPKYINNTFNNNGANTGSKALYLYHYPGFTPNGNSSTWRNNIFSNTRSASPSVMMSTLEPGIVCDMDYNNYYSNNTAAIYPVTQISSWWYVNNTGSRTLQAWRNLTGMDFGSLAYNPGYIDSMTNLRPNPARSESWSVNGRGVHDATNNKDILGNARVTLKTAGVPDLGAYEFVPTSVPPLAYTATTTPTAGTTSVYLLGQDTVMTVDWPATGTLPTDLAVRQYTGTAAPGITALGSTFMYFYVDAQPTGTAPFTTDSRIFFKDPWTGSTAKTALRMAQKDGSAAWVAHPHTSSGANATRNFIYKNALTNFGWLTGTDIANNAGALEIVTPKPLFCAGTYTLTAKIGNLGNNTLNNVQIGWQIDGGPISTMSYTTPIPTSIAGTNTANVTLGSITFASKPKWIKIWTSMPNNVIDPVPGDDTINLRWGPGLSGEYTVGGTNPDWPTLTAALADMKLFGVCGPVWFNMRSGTYTGQYRLENVQGMSTVNRVTIQSETKNASDVTLTNGGYVFDFIANASNFTLNKLSVVMTGTSGQTVNLTSANLRDSINGCVLSAPTGSSAYVIRVNSPAAVIDRFSLTNSTLTGGGYGIYAYAYNGTATNQLGMTNCVFDNNLFQNQMYYPFYTYYSGNMKVRGNEVTSTYAAYYGMYINMSKGADIIGNKISLMNNYAYGYGMYCYDYSNTAATPYNIRNNVIIMAGPNSFNAGYGGLCVYSSFSNVYNNSIAISASGGSALVLYNYSGNDQNIDIKNNVFAHFNGGNASYVQTAPNATTTMDYNNYYTTGATLIGGTATADTLTRWRIQYGRDLNSISYDPGFTSSLNPIPDVNNPASWSLNGRGIHATGNDKDYAGNTRVVNRADGVPDIGAYEFTPQTIPPAAKAIPATVAPGATQVFTFGQDTVARIKWDANTYVPASVTIRQWTGTVPPSFPVANHMYFYTDLDAVPVTYISDVDIYYKDPWTGKIPAANEGNIRMIRKESPVTPWTAYNGTTSLVNTGRNTLVGPTLTGLGYFTGIENGGIFSANIKPLAQVVFCPGGSVTLQSGFSNTGYTHQWLLNGTNIPGANAPSYTAVMSGDYSVRVTETSSSNTALSNAVAVTIVSSPAAFVTANGPTTICTGNNVTLNVGSGSSLTYQWMLNGVDIPGASSSSYLVNSGGTYSVKVKNIGCTNLSNPLTIVQGPVSVNLGNDTSFCTSAPLNLDALNPGATYLWSTGETTQTITISKYGTHRIAVHVDAGVNCIAKDTIEVTISPMPQVNGISSIRQFGNTYKFEPSGAKDVESYLWIFGDGSTDTTSSILHEYNGGTFTLKLVVFNGCGSDTTTLELPATVKDVTSRSEFELYPNPAKSSITLQVYGEAQFNDVVIVNTIGQVVVREPGTNTKSRTFDIRMLADGHYFIRANTADGKVISKPFRVVR